MIDATTSHEPREARGLLKHYLRDLIYGANHGIVTTFAIVTGVTGAALQSRVVLILGVANLLADGLSMGASNFLSIRSDEAVRRADGLAALEPFPFRHGLVTFLAFVVAGPSVAQLSGGPRLVGVPFAVGLTVVGLFGVGAFRATVADGGWLRNGLEMLFVGMSAATVAYVVGVLLAPLT